MTPDFPALCAELLDCLEKADWPYQHHDHFLSSADRARAALPQQPAPLADGPAVQGREPASVIAEPSHEELLELMSQQMRDDLAFMARKTAEHGAPAGLYRVTMNTHLAEYARAVLARWGTATPQPIPVFERLQQVEDLAADAVAGLRYIEHWHGRLSGVGWDRVFEKAKRLKPAHALPLPSEEVE